MDLRKTRNILHSNCRIFYRITKNKNDHKFNWMGIEGSSPEDVKPPYFIVM